MSDEDGQELLAAGHEQRFARGETVAEILEGERTVCLILDGTFSAHVGGREVNLLGPGDHFGEIATLDWGRDFRCQRTATVLAQTTSRLVAFPGSALWRLMAESSDVDRAIRSTAEARLLER